MHISWKLISVTHWVEDLIVLEGIPGLSYVKRCLHIVVYLDCVIHCCRMSVNLDALELV